jgi:hypothetical protein
MRMPSQSQKRSLFQGRTKTRDIDNDNVLRRRGSMTVSRYVSRYLIAWGPINHDDVRFSESLVSEPLNNTIHSINLSVFAVF